MSCHRPFELRSSSQGVPSMIAKVRTHMASCFHTAERSASVSLQAFFPGRVEHWRGDPKELSCLCPAFPPSCPVRRFRNPVSSARTSHAACAFRALRAPAHFSSRVMKPIGPEQLSVAAALDSHQTNRPPLPREQEIQTKSASPRRQRIPPSSPKLLCVRD